MKTLDVEPPMLIEVEDIVELVVDFFVTMGPDACLAESKQRMHACPEKTGTTLFSKENKKS